MLAEFRQHKIPPVGPMSVQLAYSTGTSQLLRDAKAQLPRWHDLAPDLAELLVRLRADSVLSTPLLVDERPIGVLALARDAERPGFTDTDIAVVEEFARRLADGLTAALEVDLVDVAVVGGGDHVLVAVAGGEVAADTKDAGQCHKQVLLNHL